MVVIGRTGASLVQQWKENRGAQAYRGTFVQNFQLRDSVSPIYGASSSFSRANAKLNSFGPNTFPAHNPALFACEVQVEYVAKSLFAPID